MVDGEDTWEYRLDDDDRLVGETLGCWVTRTYSDFQSGELSDTDVATTPDKVKLLAWDDAFAGSQIDLDRWRPGYAKGDYPGLRMRVDEGYYLTFPEGYSRRVWGALEPPVVKYYGVTPEDQFSWGAAEHRLLMTGDFELEVEFDRLQQVTLVEASMLGTLQLGLQVRDTKLELAAVNSVGIYRKFDPANANPLARDVWESVIQVAGVPVTVTTNLTPTLSGKLRIVRLAGVVTTYYQPSGGAWTALGAGTTFAATPLYVSLFILHEFAAATVRFRNFLVTDHAQYPASGTYTSPIYDSGKAARAWDKLFWTENLPAGTDVTFAVATKESLDPAVDPTPWTFSGSYTDPAGSALAGVTGRYFRYRATLTSTGTATPDFTGVRAGPPMRRTGRTVATSSTRVVT